MKKLILILMVGNFFMGCASITPSMLRPPENPIPNKIKSLIIGLEGENVIRNESLKTLTVQTDFATIFSRTIEQNICETNREKWGYVDAKMVFKKNKGNPINYIYLSPLFIGIYFGLPMYSSYMLEYEFAIYDSKKHKIKTYAIYKEISSSSTLYSGTVVHRIRFIDLFHSILRDFETKINADADYINSELEKGGQIN